jgi:hypothetical protein
MKFLDLTLPACADRRIPHAKQMAIGSFAPFSRHIVNNTVMRITDDRLPGACSFPN